MSGFRQDKIGEHLKRELAQIFQRESRSICKGAMVTVTVVRITGDLSIAKVYLSIFGHPDKNEVFENIQLHASQLRGIIGKSSRSMRKTPELRFYIDDSLDYAEKIDELLNK